MNTYCKKIWLNKESSPSTGSVVAYRGEMTFETEKRKAAFLEISDCHNKVRLHVSPMDTMNDFIIKMETLRNTINDFIYFLKNEKQDIEI